MCGVAGACGTAGAHVWSGERSLRLKETWEDVGFTATQTPVLTGVFRTRTAGHTALSLPAPQVLPSSPSTPGGAPNVSAVREARGGSPGEVLCRQQSLVAREGWGLEDNV